MLSWLDSGMPADLAEFTVFAAGEPDEKATRKNRHGAGSAGVLQNTRK